jgi:hypothetical protein
MNEYTWAVDAIRRFKEYGYDMSAADLDRLAGATNALADLFLSPITSQGTKREPR